MNREAHSAILLAVGMLAAGLLGAVSVVSQPPPNTAPPCGDGRCSPWEYNEFDPNPWSHPLSDDDNALIVEDPVWIGENTTWEGAYTDLDAAIDDAEPGNVIVLENGYYQITEPIDKPNLTIVGIWQPLDTPGGPLIHVNVDGPLTGENGDNLTVRELTINHTVQGHPFGFDREEYLDERDVAESPGGPLEIGPADNVELDEISIEDRGIRAHDVVGFQLVESWVWAGKADVDDVVQVTDSSDVRVAANYIWGANGTNLVLDNVDDARVIYNVIKEAETGIDLNPTDNVTLHRNDIRKNDVGVRVQDNAGTVSIWENNLERNAESAVLNEGSERLSAPQNWWGSAAGPTISPIPQTPATGSPVDALGSVNAAPHCVQPNCPYLDNVPTTGSLIATQEEI